MGMPAGISRKPNRPALEDGVKEFAVWLDRDYARDEVVIRKIEEFDPNRVYPRDCSGTVQAKDELEAYQFLHRSINSYDSSR